MRALMVVAVDEVIEALLMLEQVLRRGFDGFFLQRQVHPLVAVVLLWMPGFDAVNEDPKAQPPDRELAHVEQRLSAGEGHAVVGADGLGQTKLAKDAWNDLNA